MKDESDVWVCGECRRPENGHLTVNYVCHHCGTLLCTRHRLELPDVAFRGRLMSLPGIAVHCHKCAEAHHHVVLPPRR